MENSLKVEYVTLENLISPPWNPRYISEEEMESLVRSIREFGFVEPLVVRKETMEVLGGNQRLEAARRLGLQEVPVVFVSLPSDAKARALNLALNRISGQWDLAMLSQVLAEIQEEAPDDLILTGFREEELEELLGEIASTLEEAEDETTEPESEGEKEDTLPAHNERLVSYILRWGDLTEHTSPECYNRFVHAFDDWRRRVIDAPTLERFLLTLLGEEPVETEVEHGPTDSCPERVASDTPGAAVRKRRRTSRSP